MEDRRRMQQQILRDKLAEAESKRSPDPNMTVKMTTNTGFALGAFDMSESLAIVDDLLGYFGEDDLDEFEGGGAFFCVPMLCPFGLAGGRRGCSAYSIHFFVANEK